MSIIHAEPERRPLPEGVYCLAVTRGDETTVVLSDAIGGDLAQQALRQTIEAVS